MRRFRQASAMVAAFDHYAFELKMFLVHASTDNSVFLFSSDAVAVLVAVLSLSLNYYHSPFLPSNLAAGHPIVCTRVHMPQNYHSNTFPIHIHTYPFCRIQSNYMNSVDCYNPQIPLTPSAVYRNLFLFCNGKPVFLPNFRVCDRMLLGRRLAMNWQIAKHHRRKN